MNREIKFRAWVSIHSGCPFMTYDIQDISFETCEIFCNKLAVFTWNDGDAILMQYTGLQDKNGKEIFEGDIVELSGDIGKVCFGKFFVSDFYSREATEVIGWYVKDDIDGNEPLDEGYEIIGNIYENPELLNATREEK